MKELSAQPCTSELYELGECCRWDEVRSELYWVDVLTGRIFRARADGAKVEILRTYVLEGVVTAFAPLAQRDQGWIVAHNQSLAILSEAGELRDLVGLETHQADEVRMNDGAADPWGRYWIGSMAFDASEGRGSLYRFHESSGVETVLRGVTISNGLGWSPDRRLQYYVDSGPGTIYVFDVDEHGEVSGQRVFRQFDVASEGTPDGFCLDAEGALWVATWGGYAVRRFAPSGEELARVNLPTAQPSCCAIGGANGTTLYVTTAREDMDEATLEREKDAGRLFCVDVAVPGVPLNTYQPDLQTREPHE